MSDEDKKTTDVNNAPDTNNTGDSTSTQTQVKVKDGVVQLSEHDYNNLVKMKDDMHTYKETARELKAKLEKIESEQEATKQKQLEEKEEFKTLYETEKQKTADMIMKINNQEIDTALNVKALEAGIKKGEYIKLIDKSKVKRDGDTNEIIGVEELVADFKKNNPDLFKNDDEVPIPDTSRGNNKIDTLILIYFRQAKLLNGRESKNFQKNKNPFGMRSFASCNDKCRLDLHDENAEQP